MKRCGVQCQVDEVLTDPLFVSTATIDVKRNIFDLCTDTKDCYLAVIEVRL